MCACAAGHREVALLLYQWNRTALEYKSVQGETVYDVSIASGNQKIADEIKDLEKSRDNTEVKQHKEFLAPQPRFR